MFAGRHTQVSHRGWRSTRIALAILWLAVLLAMPAKADDGTPTNNPPPPPPAEEPANPPAPEPEPTDIPPPPPPPATEIPPAPTEAPPPPTEVPPTEVPVEPTEAPTEVPATEEPTEEPSPTPTPDAAIPFDPVVTCTLLSGSTLAAAGETVWSYQDCTVTWQTENVSAVELEAWTEAAGWRVIAVDGDDLADPDAIAVADGVLELTDTNPDDDGFLTSRFYVGTQLSCTSATSAQVQLQLTATSTAPVSEDEQGNPLSDEPGETVLETTLDGFEVSGLGPSVPSVDITAFTFQNLSIEQTNITTGYLEIAYNDVPSACGWQVVITFSDFSSDMGSVPASSLNLVEAVADQIVTASSNDGVISIIVPADPAAATSGTIRVTTSVVFPEVVPPGGYAVTATVQASSLQ